MMWNNVPGEFHSISYAHPLIPAVNPANYINNPGHARWPIVDGFQMEAADNENEKAYRIPWIFILVNCH